MSRLNEPPRKFHPQHRGLVYDDEPRVERVVGMPSKRLLGLWRPTKARVDRGRFDLLQDVQGPLLVVAERGQVGRIILQLCDRLPDEFAHSGRGTTCRRHQLNLARLPAVLLSPSDLSREPRNCRPHDRERLPSAGRPGHHCERAGHDPLGRLDLFRAALGFRRATRSHRKQRCQAIPFRVGKTRVHGGDP